MLSVAIALFVSADGYGQLHLTDAPKKAVKAFEKGQEATRQNELSEAKALFEQAVGISPEFVDPYLYLGDLSTELGEWAQAAAYYEQAISLDPYWKVGTYYRLARVLGPLEQFEAAAKALEVYLSSEKIKGSGRAKAQKLLENMRFAADAKANPLPFKPKNLGPTINTADLEYLPSISADESTLVYTIRLDGRNEDFFISKRNADGKWGPSENMGPPINTAYNEGAEHLSADGRLLFFTVCNLPESYGSCDIYFSELRNGEWSKPQNAGDKINGQSWDTQPCLSADGSLLYFISNRGGGQGDMDIWVSAKQKNGSWGVAKNLGPAVNTAGKEQTPFIHPDGATLYFSSDGHPGMGETDLYLSKLDLKGKWQVPLNLGYPINTTANEGSLVVSTDGQTAYFSSDRFDSFGGLDLYSFKMPIEIQPEPVTYVRATVLDAVSKKPISAKLEWSDLSNPAAQNTQTTATLFEGETDEKGKFLICLPSGRNYGIRVNKEDYLFYSLNFELDSGQRYEPYEIEVLLQPVAKGGEVVLRNVFFDFNSAELLASSYEELGKLRGLLETYASKNVQINGHTDDEGADDFNQQLSERRAAAVKTYLVAQGIPATRISTKGYGESAPLVPNDSAENRALNRRTTFELQ